MIPGRLTREQTRKLIDSILLGKRSLRLNKPGVITSNNLGGQPITDPLADLWPEFILNPWITTPGSIRVRYLGDWKWSFEVPGPPPDPEKDTEPEIKNYNQKLAWKASHSYGPIIKL